MYLKRHFYFDVFITDVNQLALNLEEVKEEFEECVLF